MRARAALGLHDEAATIADLDHGGARFCVQRVHMATYRESGPTSIAPAAPPVGTLNQL